MTLASPGRISELVQYQPEAIVSSAIIKKKQGNVTLFAFAQGQALSEHTAPFEALAQMIDGRMEITIGGQSHQLESGQGIILPANVPHALHAIQNAKMLLTMIKSD